MSFVNDTFTDTAGVLITAHTSDSLHTWSLHSASGAGANPCISNANRARNDTTTKIAVLLSSATPASADYDVEADLYFLTDVNQIVGVLGRLHPTNSDYYFFGYDISGARIRWQIQKSVGGVITTLAPQVNQTLTTATSYHVKGEMRGTSLSLYVDGVLTIGPLTDASISAAGQPGIFFNAITATDTTSMHIDNFSATDAAGNTLFAQSCM